MIPNTPAWQIVFEALKPEPDFSRVDDQAAVLLDENELFAICRDHGLLLIVNRALKGRRQKIFSVSGQKLWRTEVATYTLLGLTMHRELQHLLKQSAAAGILVAPFKGPTLSERLFADPALRMFTDLDLLVPHDQVCTMVELLVGEGYLPIFSPKKLRRWVRPGVQVNHCILQHSSRRWMVEVHWELFDSWRRAHHPQENGPEQPFAVFDDNMETLLYLCVHGANHWWFQLKWIVDVDRCARLVQPLDWEVLFSKARARGCARILSLALFLARQACGLNLPEWVVDELHNDEQVAALGRRVACLWSRPLGRQPSLLWKFCYLLTCRERLSDRIGMVFGYPLARSIPFLKRAV